MRITRRQLRKIIRENFVSHSDEPSIGDVVINNNPDCKHYQSSGVVLKINALPGDRGKTAEYECRNGGDHWEVGDVLEKTLDQLVPYSSLNEAYIAQSQSFSPMKSRASQEFTHFIQSGQSGNPYGDTIGKDRNDIADLRENILDETIEMRDQAELIKNKIPRLAVQSDLHLKNANKKLTEAITLFNKLIYSLDF